MDGSGSARVAATPFDDGRGSRAALGRRRRATPAWTFAVTVSGSVAPWTAPRRLPHPPRVPIAPELTAAVVFFSTGRTATIAAASASPFRPAQEGVIEEVVQGSQASWWKQLRTLTKRSFTNMSRDFGYYWLRIVVYTLMAVCLGTIYYDVGTSYTAIQARASCGGFVSGFMTFMSIGGFPSFIEEMKVFTLERQNGHYGVAVYIISNFLSSMPFLLAVSWASSSITYWMVKFRPGFSYFAFFALNLYGGVSVIESLMMIISALVPNFLMGLILGAGVIGIMMLTSGFFRLLPELPKIFWRYPVSYIVYGSWGLQGAYKNDLIGLEFEPMMPGQPKLTGEYIITKMMGLSLNYSKWLDLAMIFVLLLAYRLTFFFVLKVKEAAAPYIRVAYTRFTMKRLERRASFRKTLSMTSLSKRHNQPHPMAIQEGLNSPMPY